MILKRSLFRKALVFIVIFAVAATGIVLATTAPAGSRSVGVLKSADQNSNINNDVTHASSVPNTPDNTAPKTNTLMRHPTQTPLTPHQALY
jgi:hypothetical protein